MIPVIKNDRSGDLRYGYFYRLLTDLVTVKETDKESLPDGWIMAEAGHEDFMYCFGTSSHGSRHQIPCPINSDHGGLGSFTEVLELSVSSGEIAPFVPSIDYHIISAGLAKELAGSGLQSATTRPGFVTLWQWDGNRPDLHFLAGGHKNIEKNRVIDPPTANQCPCCGHGPILCPVCGYSTWICEQCKQKIVISSMDKKKRKRWQYLFEPASNENSVVDFHKWDGSDFNSDSGAILTKRAVDFLLSVHAHPFVAQPIAVDVAGLTDLEWKRLEETTKLVRR